MPPRTKSKVAKALKENLVTESKSTTHRNKVSKTGRNVLGDKTNSLSNNDTCIEVTNKVSTKVTVGEKNGRPRRERRLPTRFVENNVLSNLPGKDSVIAFAESSKNRKGSILNKNEIQTKQESNKKVNQPNIQPRHRKITPQVSKTLSNDVSLNSNKSTHSPFKTPTDIESYVANRPQRIHRLPSRFEEHSMSPSKFLPIKPIYTSTPRQQKEPRNNKNESKGHREKSNTSNKSSPVTKSNPKKIRAARQKVDFKKFFSPQTKNSNLSNKSSPDTNNNPKKTRPARQKVDFKKSFSPPHVTLKSKNPVSKIVRNNRILNKSQSFKVLEEKKYKENNDNVDVYEFTYDPDEEPLRKKKKKKRIVKKNPAKPKFVIFKNNYEQNLSRTLNSLKKVVSKKVATTGNQKYPSTDTHKNKIEKLSTKHVQSSNLIGKTVQSCRNDPTVKQNDKHTNLGVPSIIGNNIPLKNSINNQQPKTVITESQTTEIAPKITVANAKTSDNENKFASIRIEDIAADFELSDSHEDFNYSPVNSPIRPVTPNNIFMAGKVDFQLEDRNESIENAVNSYDPLNLQDNTEFFKEQPAASSSMNMSVKHPLASPWRVEFENLPIKWQVNTYVKSNMTPAVESSFINSKDDNKKKHVYTNLLLQSNETVPERIDDNVSNLKQTSIISFMKEAAEKSANKKKRAVSVTPTKNNSLFEDITNSSLHKNKVSSQKTIEKDGNILIQNKKASNDKENIRSNRKRKSVDTIEAVPAKSPCRQKDKDFTYFGFDDSENQDNENISPKKIDPRVRALRPRARAILQEINGQIRPTRADLPLTTKSKTITSSEAVNKMYEVMKSAEVAPSFPNKNSVQKHTERTMTDPILNENNDGNADSISVHLFEDIELTHHLKPTRKSYGKAKKVKFRQHSTSDDDTRNGDGECHSELSDKEDLGDLTFAMPAISKKKPTRKKKTKAQLSNKEKKEADAWAAGFNSMCEDIEEFPLVVE